MENLELPEWLKVTLGLFGGVFAWGLVVILAKSWVETNILDAIKDLKHGLLKLEEGFVRFTERVNTALFNVVKSNTDQMESSRIELERMSKLHTTVVNRIDDAENKMEYIDKTNEKLVRVGVLVHEKHKLLEKKVDDAVKSLETEIEKLSKDLIFVKTKTGGKKDGNGL